MFLLLYHITSRDILTNSIAYNHDIVIVFHKDVKKEGEFSIKLKKGGCPQFCTVQKRYYSNKRYCSKKIPYN